MEMLHNHTMDFVNILTVFILILCECQGNVDVVKFFPGQLADFHADKSISVIGFGSCNKQDYPQPLWKNVVAQKPDLWIWLGDAIYADTRIAPFIWIVASLPKMYERYQEQLEVPEYKAFMNSGFPIIGVWDDHDYGIDFGGKHFKYRLRSQDLFLDFLGEPIDSLRRKREGTYVSYTFGSGNKIVKVILLDVRSNALYGSNCDLLGEKQWDWFKNQLNDNSSQLIIVGSGLQIVSDIPFIEKWRTCPSSLDKLIWLTQQRSRVVFISGDVHFAESNCVNSSGTGYPFYEFTSSGMTHTCSFPRPVSFCNWNLQNVVASCYRVSSVITENNFGIIRIKWDENPVKAIFEAHSEHGVLTSTAVSFSDLERRRHPAVCPPAIEQPNWYWKRAFWCTVVLIVVSACLLAIWLLIFACRWFAREVLKDLDVKLKSGLVRLQKKNKFKHE